MEQNLDIMAYKDHFSSGFSFQKLARHRLYGRKAVLKNQLESFGNNFTKDFADIHDPYVGYNIFYASVDAMTYTTSRCYGRATARCRAAAISSLL